MGDVDLGEGRSGLKCLIVCFDAAPLVHIESHKVLIHVNSAIADNNDVVLL